MKFKGAIAVDVDGTLLNEKSRLTSRTKAVLRALSSDYLIILASGRPSRGMRKLAAELGLHIPLICYNGAAVYLSPTSEPSLYLDLDADKLKAVYLEAASFLTSCAFESETVIYALRSDAYLSRYFPYDGMEVKVGEEVTLPKRGLMASLFRCPHRYDGKLKSIVEGQKGFRFRHWTASTYSEITRIDVSKGQALALVLNHFGIKASDCHAFGDSTNDESMLALVGHPHLMADSLTTLPYPRTEKGHAEDGVAWELSRIFRL